MRRRAELREAGNAQRRLAEATRLLASSLDLRQVLDRFATITLELMRADLVSIWLTSDGESHLMLEAQAGELHPGVAQPLRPERGKGLTGCILATGRPLPIEDMEREPRVWNRAWYAHQQVRSFLGVPLLVDGAAVGVMACMTRSRRGWSADDVEYGEALATAAAVAIRNAQRHGETQERLQQLSHTQTLLTVARAVNSTLDFTELMRRVAREIGRALGADMVGAYLADANREGLRPVAGYHVPPELRERFLQFPISIRKNPYIEEGWRNQQPAWSSDAQTDGRSDPALIAWAPLRSVIFFPLVVKDEPIGALFLIWWAPRPAPTPLELLLLEGIARQTALAIGNAQLFEETERRLRETEALLGVADSVSQASDVGEIMRRVCREATRALGADCGVFYTVDESSSLVMPAAGYHVPKDVLAEARPVPVGEVPLPMIEARRDRKILFVPDVKSDARFDTPSFRAAKVRSMLMSPIFSKERLFGDVLLYWWDAAHAVSDGDLALMAAISAQAALALENARLLAETQSQAAALREKNTELDTFVYTVSHDLKAPLVTIQGMATLVLEDHAATLDEEGRHYLQRVVANTQQMERLILDLLALSRIGREAHEVEVVHLAELVDDVVADLAEPLHAHGIKVTVGDMQSVSGVRVQLEQVMRNLLTNAIKYMGDTPSPEIELGTIARGAEIEVWVRDTGIGIDPAYHEKVFEIFQRLKEIEADGSGVGLPIVKKIVHAAGGRIWVESARGQGSTFRFTWPVATGR